MQGHPYAKVCACYVTAFDVRAVYGRARSVRPSCKLLIMLTIRLFRISLLTRNAGHVIPVQYRSATEALACVGGRGGRARDGMLLRSWLVRRGIPCVQVAIRQMRLPCLGVSAAVALSSARKRSSKVQGRLTA